MSNFFHSNRSDPYDLNKRRLADIFLIDNSISGRFRDYGMDSVMFFYVLVYKSVLISIICLVLLTFYLVLIVTLTIFPKSKRLRIVKEFFSYALFFNVPFRYFQLVLLDLFISAFMTFRTVALKDAESDIVFVRPHVD